MIGKTILHYKIVEKLGQGGMGAVFKAEDTKLDRTVALKFLPANALADEGDRARFLHEAQAAAALHDPNICTVYEINEADDQVFISMAYLSGGNLRDKIEHGPVATEDILKIAIQIGRGLEAAHKKGIVHRDIKPSNIMFSESGVATVMDFGLAKSKRQTHVTRLGTTMGTIAYMSPEQTRGDEVDHRTDIWSLGVMLYEMTAGQRPFKGDYDEAVIYSILNEVPKPVEELRKNADTNLVYIIRKAMAKNPADRYQTAAEMLADLELALDEVKVGSSKSRSATRTRLGPLARRKGKWGLLRPVVLLPSAAVIAALIIVLVITFGGGKRGVAETVAVVDEKGQTIERFVPKSEYRRSFALAFFDNKTGNAENDWLGVAIPLLLEEDLLQDQFLTVRSAFDPFAIERLQRAGFKSWEQAPWSFKQRLANESNLDYLVTGSFSVEDGGYVVTRTLHDASTGRLAATQTYKGPNLFSLVDEMSVDTKRDVNIPDTRPGGVKDLPVAEMMTSSLEALKAFSIGTKKAWFEHDWPGSIALVERATMIDSTMAGAYMQLLDLYVNGNQGEKMDWALQRLMRHVYKLPERIQFEAKAAYYVLNKEPEKSIAVLRMATELYPADVTARQTLAENLAARNEMDKAIAEYNEILRIDPNRTEFLRRIGLFYREKGDFSQALVYFERYAKANPENTKSFTEIGGVYDVLGEYDQAATYYEKALLLDPENVSVLRALADIDAKLGRSDIALKKYNDALRMARSPRDRIEIYSGLQEFYLNRGELEKSFEQMRLKWDEYKSVYTPVQLMIRKSLDARILIKAKRPDEAFAIIESIRKEIQPPYDELVPLGYVYAYLELEEADSAEAALKRLMPFIEAYRIEQLRGDVYFAEGRIAEIRGDYRKAIERFEKEAAATPADPSAHFYIGRCQRKLGEYEKASTSLTKMLKVFPNDPEVLYELALLDADQGRKAEALKSLQKALSVWENADPVYEPATKAREKLAEWTS